MQTIEEVVSGMFADERIAAVFKTETAADAFADELRSFVSTRALDTNFRFTMVYAGRGVRIRYNPHTMVYTFGHASAKFYEDAWDFTAVCIDDILMQGNDDLEPAADIHTLFREVTL